MTIPRNLHYRQMLRTSSRGARVLASVTSLTLLYSASCAFANTASASRDSLTSNSPLCRAISEIERLTVTRTITIKGNRIEFTFPTLVTVRSAQQSRLVATALCSLPKRPRGVYHCPADLGVVYHLLFSSGSKSWPVITVEATGCEFVRGLNTDRWAAQSPQFWRTLGTAMGLRQAGHATFAGSLVN
jgi:hypothetical protein